MTKLERLTAALRQALSEYRPGTDQQEESVQWVARALDGGGVIILTSDGPWRAEFDAEREDLRYLLVRDIEGVMIVHGQFATKSDALVAAGALNALQDT